MLHSSGILSGIHSNIPSGAFHLASGSAFYLTYILTFYLTYVLAFYLAFSPAFSYFAPILAYLGILSGIYSYILSGLYSDPSVLHCLRSSRLEFRSMRPVSLKAYTGNIPPPPQAAGTVAYTCSFLLFSPDRGEKNKHQTTSRNMKKKVPRAEACSDVCDHNVYMFRHRQL